MALRPREKSPAREKIPRLQANKKPTPTFSFGKIAPEHLFVMTAVDRQHYFLKPAER
jgi:hypothetical protein